MDWVKELKVGDRVLVEHFIDACNIEYKIRPITLIKANGLIVVDDELYSPTNARCRSCYHKHIRNLKDPFFEVKFKEFARQKKRDVVRRLNEITNLTFEQAVVIEELLNEMRIN